MNGSAMNGPQFSDRRRPVPAKAVPAADTAKSAIAVDPVDVFVKKVTQEVQLILQFDQELTNWERVDILQTILYDRFQHTDFNDEQREDVHAKCFKQLGWVRVGAMTNALKRKRSSSDQQSAQRAKPVEATPLKPTSQVRSGPVQKVTPEDFLLKTDASRGNHNGVRPFLAADYMVTLYKSTGTWGKLESAFGAPMMKAIDQLPDMLLDTDEIDMARYRNDQQALFTKTQEFQQRIKAFYEANKVLVLPVRTGSHTQYMVMQKDDDGRDVMHLVDSDPNNNFARKGSKMAACQRVEFRDASTTLDSLVEVAANRDLHVSAWRNLFSSVAEDPSKEVMFVNPQGYKACAYSASKNLMKMMSQYALKSDGSAHSKALWRGVRDLERLTAANPPHMPGA